MNCFSLFVTDLRLYLRSFVCLLVHPSVFRWSFHQFVHCIGVCWSINWSVTHKLKRVNLVNPRIEFWETEANALKSKLITWILDRWWIGSVPLKFFALGYPSTSFLRHLSTSFYAHCYSSIQYSFIDNCRSKSVISKLFKAEESTDARCSVLICFMALKLSPSVVLIQLKFLFIVCRQGNLCVGRFQEEICATRHWGIICTPDVRTARPTIDRDNEPCH